MYSFYDTVCCNDKQHIHPICPNETVWTPESPGEAANSNLGVIYKPVF